MSKPAPRSSLKPPKSKGRPPFECIALLLQGGGALGAYQGGVFQALDEAGIHPDWVAGISIGAINSAIIAGNAPEKRVEKLRAFWEHITLSHPFDMSHLLQGDLAQDVVKRLYAGTAVVQGIEGFFKPRMVSPWFAPAGASGATSFFDTAPLKATLEEFADFDRINHCDMRFSVGAVNVRSGNFVHFDNERYTITPEHIMASGALPPSFAAVEIEGEFYWDGGLVSNTPLDWVLNQDEQEDTLAFQVDLWSATGDIPADISHVATRQKEIQYSSRTRASTNRFREMQKRRYAVANLLDQLPKELKNSPDAKMLQPLTVRKVYNIVHLIHRSHKHDGEFKDYEFSRATMEDNWLAGYNDTVRTLRHEQVLKRPEGGQSVQTFDMTRDGRD